MISSLGKGLNILISCDHSFGHNWMSYLCYYSIFKNLPEAKVFVVCRRRNVTGSLFLWTKMFNVPFKMYNGEYDIGNLSGIKDVPLLITSPEVIAIRDFEEAKQDQNILNDRHFLVQTNFLCEAKEDTMCVFSSYLNGFGNFVTSEWIDNMNCPLVSSFSKRFFHNGMNSNEVRMADIWKESISLFQTISTGKL